MHRKDQMDQEKKKLRLLQEMYLQDGDMHQSKGHRKKNFRWKNIDGKLEKILFLLLNRVF